MDPRTRSVKFERKTVEKEMGTVPRVSSHPGSIRSIWVIYSWANAGSNVMWMAMSQTGASPSLRTLTSRTTGAWFCCMAKFTKGV